MTHDAYCPREISFVFEGNARKKIVKKMQLNLPKPSKQLFCLVSALIPPENMCADIRYVSIYSEIGTSRYTYLGISPRKLWSNQVQNLIILS